MSAQIITLSDRRKTRRTSFPSLIGLSFSIFAAYADINLALYRSMVDAAQQGLQGCLSW
jgi:hypothetical protein